jgi:hypothetical protein
MLKKFGLPTLLLGTALALLSPAGALARDHDRDDWRHERHEWREHHRHFRGYVYYGPRYRNGYYDRWGYWHPYAGGYYDRRGYYHAYGY